MTITLNGTTGITTPDVNVTAQSSNIVTTGNITAVDATLSGGVYVGGTGSANYLDDYEEGTWTPVLTPASGSITTQSSYGYYTKIGNNVTVVVAISIENGGSASGTGYITGLPFTSQTVQDLYSGGERAGSVAFREDGVTGYWYFGYVLSNDTQVTVSNSTNGGLNYANSCCYVSSFVYRSAT